MRKITLLILVFTLSIFAQNKIEKVRENIAEINLGFLNSSQPSVLQINELVQLLDSVDSKDINMKRTIDELNDFKAFLKNENDVDTIMNAFRKVNNQFNTDAGKYFYNKLLRSSKQKILVFSTSMSCECTLEMCYRQESEVQKFCKENHEQYDYAILDTWTNSDIQNEYQAGFVPTVLVLSEDNAVLNRSSRNEKLINLLKELIKKG